MIWADLVLGAPQWMPAAVMFVAAMLALALGSYWRSTATLGLRVGCLLLKMIAVLLLAACLVDPLYVGARPRPGSNLFLVVADNSRSLQLADRGEKLSRGEKMKARLAEREGWLARLGQDFEVRSYVFDESVRAVQDFSQTPLDGDASSLRGTLTSLGDRFRGRPLAGILLLTDGNATDLGDGEWDMSSLPPIYPATIASSASAADVSVTQLAVSQTNFEASPVTISAEIDAQSLAGRTLLVRVLDEAGEEVERRTVKVTADDERISQRFLVKPDKPGISFFAVQAALQGEENLRAGQDASEEATLANNRRWATVDRGGGPYRVLYVSGKPNWEFKFLRRAISKDDEVKLVGLVRIARKEPKFNFLARDGERTNPLFRGFGNKDDDTAEQYDEPVLIRLGTEDKEELRGGFPKDAEDLYRYHALVFDDVESKFFTQDQMSLVQQFVSQRGGALLMLGGKDSFGEGGFARTAIGEMLPVYLDRTASAPDATYRLKLTREGWLSPWLRLRTNEPEEQVRLASMPEFQTLNRIDAIKPGATVLAEVEGADGSSKPALVAQPFGRGKSAALLLGDLWRWDMRRENPAESDLEKAWRQTIRWLAADVPKPVEVEPRPLAGSGLPATELVATVRDRRFAPLDNAAVTATVKTPSGNEVQFPAESSAEKAGEYRATFVPREAGVYRATVKATAPDGSEVGERQTGWTVEPETNEFRQLAGNTALLERLATATGGQMVSLDDLDRFAAKVPQQKAPVTETWSYPIWHRWSIVLIAMTCLVGEWGLRRWKGLP